MTIEERNARARKYSRKIHRRQARHNHWLAVATAQAVTALSILMLVTTILK